MAFVRRLRLQGHHIGEARLENPDEIIRNYLEPALQNLKGSTAGPEAGQVFHTFAVFCDRQLHNPDFIQEFDRVSKAHQKWEKEVDAYRSALTSSRSKHSTRQLQKDMDTAQKWLNLNNGEYKRYVSARESLIVQCLENYLRSLAAWDDHDSDALRLFSIWLEWAEKSAANDVVSKQIGQVPSAKFAILMNQLTSILQNDSSIFQLTLKGLIGRICVDHPFQSLHHIFGPVHGRGMAEPSSSRSLAIQGIAETFKKNKHAFECWGRIYRANSMYHDLAMYKDKLIAAGRDLTLESIPPSAKLIGRIRDLKVPPATLRIPLRRDKDYKSVPTITHFLSKMTIATGISAPKIVTAIGSDGERYKQLVRSMARFPVLINAVQRGQ
jgi:ataxia telangiectasia mutated family protein